MATLEGRIAVVTGASRGIGRGIALALAEAGATVYVTGRSVTRESHELPGTVGATAVECTGRGGIGIPVAVDHRDDAKVAALFDRVADEQGRLDILVNNAFAVPEGLGQVKPFWEGPISGHDMLEVGLWSNYVAACHAARLMVPRSNGLIVTTSGYAGVTFTFSALFGACKSAVDRLARDMAVDLKPYGVCSLSLWQSLTMTERTRRNLAEAPDLAARAGSQVAVCSPEFPGRVIAAVAADSAAMDLSGGTFITAELASRYGITDIDGRTIPSQREQRGSPIWQPIG